MRQNVKALMELNPREQSLEAMLDIKAELLSTSRDIELQLSSKNRTGFDGKRLPPGDYGIWRHRAISFKNHVDDRYRQYKRLSQRNQKNEQAKAPAANAKVDAALDTLYPQGSGPGGGILFDGTVLD